MMLIMKQNRQFEIPAIDILGRENVQSWLASHGYTNPVATMNAWVKRREVPGKVVVNLVQHAEAKGTRLKVADFVVKEIS